MLLTLPNETPPELAPAFPKAVLPNLAVAASVLPRPLELRPPKVVQQFVGIFSRSAPPFGK